MIDRALLMHAIGRHADLKWVLRQNGWADIGVIVTNLSQLQSAKSQIGHKIFCLLRQTILLQKPGLPVLDVLSYGEALRHSLMDGATGGRSIAV